ncbi:MAG: PilZ domain-containing protein [Myxococcaceae bacterium]
MPAFALTKVAVIDDDLLQRTIIADSLTEGGFQVETFASAEEALSALERASVDAIITDLHLPHMNGFELLRELRTRAGLVDVPCVAISAREWPEADIARARETHALIAIVRKPLDLKDFTRSMEALLRQSAPPQEAPRSEGVLGHRRAARVGVRLAVKLRNAEDVAVEYSENLSHNGIFIRTLSPAPLHARVNLELSVPYQPEPLSLQGTVVRVVPPGDPSGSGIALALEDVPSQVKRELHAFLAGFREGLNHQNESDVPRRVVMLGARPELAEGLRAFLSRDVFQVTWANTVSELSTVTRPEVLVVDANFAPKLPLQSMQSLKRANPQMQVFLFDDATTVQMVPKNIERVRSIGDLEALLSERLHVPRRRAERIAVFLPAHARRVDGELVGTLEDVSLGGLGMLLRSPCAVGEGMDVEFELPDGQGPIHARVSVQRATVAGRKRFRVGASFMAPTPELLTRLRAFITREPGEVARPRRAQR